jgi:hypothetical protein
MKTKPWIACGAAALLAACGSGNPDKPNSRQTQCGAPVDGQGVLQSFDPPCDPGGGGVLFTASGEVLAYSGYDFPAAADQEAVFVDGWEVKFTRAIVTFDHITLSENPDKVPTDESKTDAVVAQVDGPWAVELHEGGAIAGKGGTDKAVAVAALSSQNKNGDKAFDPTRRYAFGFETIAATPAAKNVNLDAEDLTAYQEMIRNGYSLYIEGDATWKGTHCTSTQESYDFSKLPKVVHFKFGYKIPAVFANCQNPDNDPAQPFDGEEHLRGVAIKANAPVTAQLTFHLDHGFWESTEHDSPAHFDQFAARFFGATSTPTITTENLVGVDFTSFKDSAGNDLPWRKCIEEYELPESSTLAFDSNGLPANPSAAPDQALRDYADYQAYNMSALGHLNADGLCSVKRSYLSPP